MISPPLVVIEGRSFMAMLGCLFKRSSLEVVLNPSRCFGDRIM